MAKAKTDANQDAARVVGEATGSHAAPPDDQDAAWADWSRRIQGTDERTLTLLRAAFDAGVDTGRALAGKAHGRAGGLKGGRARARSLSKKQRKDIATKAARSRWGS